MRIIELKDINVNNRAKRHQKNPLLKIYNAQVMYTARN